MGMKQRKNIFALLLCTFFLNLFSGVALANYPAHLNGDPEYLLVDGHMGTAWYVEKSSVNVEECEPPTCVITVNVVTAVSAVGDVVDFYDKGGEGTITAAEVKRFYYNDDGIKMYIDKTGDNNWQYLEPTGSWAACGVSMPAGEMAFYLAKGRRFYGSSVWNGHKAFSDNFYANAD